MTYHHQNFCFGRDRTKKYSLVIKARILDVQSLIILSQYVTAKALEIHQRFRMSDFIYFPDEL